MKAIVSLLVFLSLGVTTSAFAADSYVCIGGKTIRLIYDDKTKECRSTVEESYNIYIIEKHSNPKNTWGLRKSGEGSLPYLCDDDSNDSGYLLCDFMGDFKMFKQNLKFLNTYLDGSCYTTDTYGNVTGKAGKNAPYIEMGRCHPL